MVDRGNYVWMGCEEGICFDFLERLRHGFLAEWAADFLEGVETAVGGVLDEVDVGEAALQELQVSHYRTRYCAERCLPLLAI